MQDTVRGELEQVLHPDFTAPTRTRDRRHRDRPTVPSIEETDHAALPPGSSGPTCRIRPSRVRDRQREHERARRLLDRRRHGRRLRRTPIVQLTGSRGT